MTRNEFDTMRRLVLIVTYSLAIGLVGCSQHVRTVPIELASDARSGFVALRVLRADHETPFVVEEQYAVLIDWREQPPSARRFLVYRRPEGRVELPADFDEFLQCVRKLPGGSSIARLDACCTSWTWGMPQDALDRLDDAIAFRAKRLRRIDEYEAGHSPIFCVCENAVVRLPGDD